MERLKFGLVLVLLSFGAQAQDRQKPLRLQLGEYNLEPIIQPTLAERIPRLGSAPALDPLANKEIHIFIGARWTDHGTKMEFKVNPRLNRPEAHFEVHW